MENKDKKMISGFLMVVGVVFILIAGSVFVSTAWRYMPESGKKVLLLGATVFLFAVSERLWNNGSDKAGTALFYLGVGFAGYFVISALGGFYWGMTDESNQLAAWKLFASHIVMLVLSCVFLLRRRKNFSLGISIILLDGCLFWGSIWASMVSQWFGYSQFLILQAGVLVLFSVGDVLEDVWIGRLAQGEKRGMQTVYYVFWILHVAQLFWMTVLGGVFDDFQTGEGFLFTFLLTAASTITYQKRRMVIFRVINSILLFVTVYVGVRELSCVDGFNAMLRVLRYGNGDSYMGSSLVWSDWDIAFAAFVINLGIMLWLRRREMKTLLVLWGELLMLFQPYFHIPQLFNREWRSGLIIIGVVLLGFIWYDKCKEIRWVQFAVICQQLLGLLLHDLNDGQLENVLILGVTCLVILVAASIYKRKEYVIASSVLLLLIAVYLTRNVWLSIAWWVYLLVAGIVLIVIAVRCER